MESASSDEITQFLPGFLSQSVFAMQIQQKTYLPEHNMININNLLTESTATHIASGLNMSEGFSHAIFEASPVPLAINDEHGRIVMLNRAFIQTVGYTLDDIPTLSDWWPLAYPDAAYRQRVTDSWQINFESAARCESPFVPLELNIHCKDGRGRTFMVSAAPLGKGFSGTHLVILYDITERIQAESDLKAMQNAALFQATFNQAAVGIAHVSLGGNWLRVNDKICQIVGYSREELMDLTFQDITHADDLNLDLANSKLMLTGEIATYSMEKRYLHKLGAIVWVRLTVSLTKKPDSSPDYFISVIENITPEKMAALELKQLRAQADMLLEQQAIAQTVMALAHELNQPLNAAGSYSEAALRLIKMDNINRVKLNQVIQLSVSEIQRAGNVMRNLMRNIHQSTLETEEFELSCVLHDTIKIFKAAMNENSAIVVLECPHSEFRVNTRRLCVEKVLMNLLWNAQQATSSNTDHSVAPTINLHVSHQPDSVIITVIDNGPEIIMETADKLFDPFFTTKLNGVGMGLSISRALIESCNGKLWYRPVEGKTAFHFSIKTINETMPISAEQRAHNMERRMKSNRRKS